jgi:osmoprotectant transport system substrate-binding protein
VPARLTVLDKSAAEDKDAVVVSKAVADRYSAKSIADLAPHCGELVFGGPSEFETRPDGIPGIKKTYNCAFKSYLSLDTGPVTVKAVTDNTVQAADIFTTNPAIEENNLVALEDPKHNFAAQNVVPLINSAKASDQVKQVLNAISAKLTTAALVDLNRQLNAPDKPDSSTVAKAWLSQNGLG